MGDSTPFPSPAAIARAELFTRERFVYDGESLEDALAPGSARRRALDAALAEVDAGADKPSIEWRRQVLAAARARAAAVRGGAAPGRRHRALGPPGRRAVGHADRAARRGPARTATAAVPAHRRPRLQLASVAIPGEDDAELDEDDGDGEDEEPQDWQDEGDELDDDVSSPSARGPERRPPLLVRARDRRRQDGRGARVRRGLAHRRRADPHPPPQPRRPVQRRAARPRLPRPDQRAAARRARTPPTGR